MNRNCAMAASLQYLLVSMQETVRKGKNAKFAREDVRLLSMVLRLENPQKKENDSERKDIHCTTVNMGLEIISMCVVPLMVKEKLKTYAMLDTCSQATFGKENLSSDLGIQGKKTSIRFKTMSEKVTKSSEALEDLEVALVSNRKAERVWVKSPSTYIQEDFPVDSKEVAAIDMIKSGVIWTG